MKKVVYICKSASDECSNGRDGYTIELEKKGYVTKTIPVVDFAFKNISELKSKLCQPENYSGIIFTSPRCVKAVVYAVKSGLNLRKEWHELQNFSVGETTAQLASDNLNLNTQGSCAGNGVRLAPIIISTNPSKPLLLPCGNLKMDTLERLLAEGGVTTDPVEVYETVPHPQLEQLLLAALSEDKPSYIVFFSPSGLHNTYPLLKKFGLDLEKIKCVSIGPTTAAALKSYGLPVHCSAERPTPHCLAETIASSGL